MDEFDFIRDMLSPLSGPEGLGLTDDAALYKPADGFELVITKDAMVEGVHFPKGQYGGHIAEKLLRVNLSDLAAKGARPKGYFLSIAIPSPMSKEDLQGFVHGLRDVQQAYDFTLWGGDTVSTSGPLVISATFIGDVPTGEMVKRSGAVIGDDIWVSGTIGDSYLGLQNVLGHVLAPKPTADQLWFWEDAYLRPEPRLLFRKVLRRYASSCLDISDGFLADAQHLARASDVQLNIMLDNIPFSPASQIWLGGQKDMHAGYEKLLSGGDDYELLFTANPSNRDELDAAARQVKMPISRVGSVIEGQGVEILDGQHSRIIFNHRGYTHKII